MLLRKKENQKRAKNVRQKMKEKWKMRVKLEERNKIKKANGNAQRVIEIKHQMSATGEAEAKARTKAQKSCHMQRSSAKMAATCLTSCKRAKGIREAAKEGEESSVCVC